MYAIVKMLTALHLRFDDEIRVELARRFPDTMKLLRLKRLRLAVKDRLHRIRAIPMREMA